MSGARWARIGASGVDAVVGEQQGFDREARGGEQTFERDRAFDDEAAVMADQVAVLHGAIGGDARVVRGVEGDDHAAGCGAWAYK